MRQDSHGSYSSYELRRIAKAEVPASTLGSGKIYKLLKFMFLLQVMHATLRTMVYLLIRLSRTAYKMR